jgi:hypothetical protein
MPYNPDGTFSLAQSFGTGTSPDNQFPSLVGNTLDDIASSITISNIFSFSTVTSTVAVTFASIVAGSPTGGNKGAGSVNAQTLWLNGTQLGTAATKNVGVSNGNVVQLDSVGLPAVDGSQLTGISTTGRLVAGTPLIINPYAVSTTTAQAHGLGAEPVYCKGVLECLTAEFGYSIGDRILLESFSATPPAVQVDATNVTFVSQGATPIIVRKDTHAQGTTTAANWKFTVTPYKLT